WAEFIAALPMPVSFRYRDTATEWLAPDAPLPVLLAVEADTATELLSSEAINGCEDLEALMTAVTEVSRLR
ncbi:MAG: hypothetical protein ACPGU1_19700, partial [Myxococcota bacterium]